MYKIDKDARTLDKWNLCFIAVLFGTCMTYDVTKKSSTILKVFDYHDEQI